MAMTRRRFGRAVVWTATSVLAGGWGVLRRSRPVQVVRAWRVRRFPGRVVPLEERQWKRPGPWAG